MAVNGNSGIAGHPDEVADCHIESNGFRVSLLLKYHCRVGKIKYTKENPLRLYEICAGYGSQAISLKRLHEVFTDFEFKCVGWCDYDPESPNVPIDKQPAVIAHRALHPDCLHNDGDLTQIDWTKVPDFDLLTASTPCFEKGTLVLTENGYKAIEDITSEDRVLTHTNSFKRVVTPMCHLYKGNMVKIYGMSTDIIYCTEEHPFYVRRMYRKGHDSERLFHEPEWIKAKNLDTNCYLGYAINQKSQLPKWDGALDKAGRKTNKLSQVIPTADFWYIMGRYVGDGWKRDDECHKAIIIACSERNMESLLSTIERLDLHPVITKERTVTKVTINSLELCAFVSRFGYYAHGKKVDAETMDLPVCLLKAFLCGYIDSDGCYDGKLYKTCSVSRELCFGIGQCVAKCYHRPFAIYRTARPATTTIEGRTVNQRDDYHLSWKVTSDKQDKAFYEDGVIWYPLSKLPIFEYREMEVYNMEVSDDNSYTANGAIVHNCQSISAAGLQHGFVQGSGTRSSIIWNVHDAVRIKRPKYILMENVSAILTDKFLPLLRLWMKEVERMGYVNFLPKEFDTSWNGSHTKNGCLNSKNYGTPQNRERWFMVSILRTEQDPNPQYHFPRPFKLEKCLNDVLEDDVDESYFLSDEMLARFCIKSMEEEGISIPIDAFPKGEEDDFGDFFVCG